MNIRNSLPSVIYRMSTTSGDLTTIPRDNRVGIAIEMSVDKIFMIMYCRRSILHQRSVAHIKTAIVKVNNLINNTLATITLNTVEEAIIDQLNTLYEALVKESTLPRVVTMTDEIDFLLNRISFNNSTIPDLIRQIKFVLAVANQLDYKDTSIVVPCIRVIECDAPYTKSYTTTELLFDLKRNLIYPLVNNCWYNIFNGIRLQSSFEDNIDKIKCLCATINIGTMPDIFSGNGLSRFLYEAYISSDVIKRFVDESHGKLFDTHQITTLLSTNNITVGKDMNLQTVGSLEADYTDSVSPPEQDSTDDGGKENEQPVEKTTEDTEAQTTDDPPADNSEDTGAEDPPTDETADNSDVTFGDEATDNDSSSDDLDNTPERRPILLGLDLALPKNETLDDFLYKLSVARFIDNVNEFNHDELPLETVTMLVKWKSALLFLTDAGETKRLLKELNIKLK